MLPVAMIDGRAHRHRPPGPVFRAAGCGLSRARLVRKIRHPGAGLGAGALLAQNAVIVVGVNAMKSIWQSAVLTLLAILIATPALAQKRNLVVATSHGGRRQARSASDEPAGADKGMSELDLQRAGAHQARPGQSGVHRAGSRRKLDCSTPTRPNGPSRSARACMPRQLRRVHRRGRRLFAEARRRPRRRSAFAGDFASIDTVEARRQPHAEGHAEEPDPEPARPARPTITAA